MSSLNGSTGFAVHGSATFDNVGFESASTGDVNGDGLDDVIIGVPGGGTNGDAYVVFGQTSAFSAEFDVTASGLFKFNGTTSVSGGYNVSAAGDVNGDGYDDFLISQHRINANAGDGHLIFGGENLAGVTVNQGTLGGSPSAPAVDLRFQARTAAITPAARCLPRETLTATAMTTF